MTLVTKVADRSERLFRSGLRLIFQFDKWHIAPLRSRRYAIAIVNYLNQQDCRNSIVEIGCGLGDILRHVQFRTKYGYDLDGRVLQGARLLSFVNGRSSRNYFCQFSFPTQSFEGLHDAILLVNWIHHIEPAVLRETFSNYFNTKLAPGGVLIFDTVADPAYRYNHNEVFLTGDLDCSLTCIGLFERNRKVWAVKKL